MRAILFDFNGVIADDEPTHIACFQQALADVGLALTVEEYYGRFLGMDERTCARLLQRKTDLFRTATAQHHPALFPGVVEFVQRAAQRCRVAVSSGGRREQIVSALAGTALEKTFDVIVAADDCPIGKPEPAIYLMTLARLNARAPEEAPIRPNECLVIEDSRAGIEAARAAGMTVLALSTTYPADQLSGAAMVLPDLNGVTLEQLGALVSPARTQV